MSPLLTTFFQSQSVVADDSISCWSHQLLILHNLTPAAHLSVAPQPLMVKVISGRLNTDATASYPSQWNNSLIRCCWISHVHSVRLKEAGLAARKKWRWMNRHSRKGGRHYNTQQHTAAKWPQNPRPTTISSFFLSFFKFQRTDHPALRNLFFPKTLREWNQLPHGTPELVQCCFTSIETTRPPRLSLTQLLNSAFSTSGIHAGTALALKPSVKTDSSYFLSPLESKHGASTETIRLIRDGAISSQSRLDFNASVSLWAGTRPDSVIVIKPQFPEKSVAARFTASLPETVYTLMMVLVNGRHQSCRYACVHKSVSPVHQMCHSVTRLRVSPTQSVLDILDSNWTVHGEARHKNM